VVVLHYVAPTVGDEALLAKDLFDVVDAFYPITVVVVVGSFNWVVVVVWQ